MRIVCQQTILMKNHNKSKKDDRTRYKQAPHLTHDTTWESNRNTINITNKTEEPKGQHFPSR